MKQLYVRWHSRQELRSIKAILEEHGYKGYLPQNYEFPIVVVDTMDREYFGTNTTCMAARASCGGGGIIEPDELGAALPRQ